MDWYCLTNLVDTHACVEAHLWTLRWSWFLLASLSSVNLESCCTLGNWRNSWSWAHKSPTHVFRVRIFTQVPTSLGTSCIGFSRYRAANTSFNFNKCGKAFNWCSGVFFFFPLLEWLVVEIAWKVVSVLFSEKLTTRCACRKAEGLEIGRMTRWTKGQVCGNMGSKALNRATLPPWSLYLVYEVNKSFGLKSWITHKFKSSS